MSTTTNVYDATTGMLDIVGKRGKRRQVPLAPKAKALLDAYLSTVQPKAPWLFYGPTGSPLTPSDVRYVTRALGPAAGIEGLSPHRLRHTVATNLLAEGVDIKTIQEILGHASLRSLEPYLHTTAAARRKALERLE